MSAGVRRSLEVLESPEELRLRTWLQLVRAFTLMERRVAGTFAEQGLTVPQFDVLATLRVSEGVTQQTLAERLLVTKGNVCGLLDRLEKLGWVERRPDEKDARANRLHLTAAGRRKVDEVMPAHQAFIAASLSAISDDDMRSLRRMLAAIERAAEA